jgi:SAM-dependent methyltransferase
MTTRRPEFIARQSAHPSGILGRLLAHIMRRETRAANDITIDLAGIRGSDRVLDVGCGSGQAVARVAERLTTGKVVGVDRSPTMVRHARGLNRRAIARGLAEIRQGDVYVLPFPDAAFDRVLATHTVYFWRDLAAAARELRRVLQPDGVLVLGFGDAARMRQSFPESVYTLRGADEIAATVRSAGFAAMSLEVVGGAGQELTWLRAGREL